MNEKKRVGIESGNFTKRPEEKLWPCAVAKHIFS